MARKVFYSFHYDNDITRVMVVRNRWVTYSSQIASGIIDKAEFERIKRQGDASIKRWIDSQLDGTTATIVLIGSETLTRHFVCYEICQSINRGNAVLGIHINSIKNMPYGSTSLKGNITTVIGKQGQRDLRFCDIANGIYDYVMDDGYNNLNAWIEEAIRRKSS